MLKNICCSICLTTNKRSINIYKTDLQCTYENLANYKIRGNECWMCYICHTRLRQCHRLQQLAIQTRGLIYDLYQNKINISLGVFGSLLELAILKNENISTKRPYSFDIKQEPDVKTDTTNDSVIEEDESFENIINDYEKVVLEDPLLVSDVNCSLTVDQNDTRQGSKVLELKIVKLSENVVDKYIRRSSTTHTAKEYHEDGAKQTAALCADEEEEIKLEIGDKDRESSPIHTNEEFQYCIDDYVDDDNIFSDINEPAPEDRVSGRKKRIHKESVSAAEETQIIPRGALTPLEISSPILNSHVPDFEDPFEKEFCTTYLETYAIRPQTPPSIIIVTSPDVTQTTKEGSKNKTYKTTDVGKKRFANKEQWCEVQRKKLKNEGKSYISKRGKQVAEKELGQPCEKKCRYKCTENFDIKQREAIFSKFWKLGDRNKQWEFVIKYTKKNNKRRETTEKTKQKREYTYIYYLPTAEKETIRVCKKMFLSTISSGERIITTAWKKFDGMTGVKEDMRGKYEHKPRVIDDVMVQSVKDHVNCIDRVVSYYARKDTKTLYFSNVESISQMYKLYVEWYDPNKYTNQANKRQYRDIVKANFNLAFHKPNKNLREACERPVSYRKRTTQFLRTSTA